MRRFLAWSTALAAAAATACGGGPPVGDRTFKPSECQSTQFEGDLAGAPDGRHAAYVTENLGRTMTQVFKVVGTDGADRLVEHWIFADETGYGYLFRIGADRRITKAWSATRDDTAWTAIRVKPPVAAGSAELPASKVKASRETIDVEAGAFDCTRIDMILRLHEKDFPSTAWYSKDAPRLYRGGEHGGLVEMRAAAGRTWLQAAGDGAKPSFPLPGP